VTTRSIAVVNAVPADRRLVVRYREHVRLHAGDSVTLDVVLPDGTTVNVPEATRAALHATPGDGFVDVGPLDVTGAIGSAATFKLRFRLVSDNDGNEDRGWYLDDLEVALEAAPPPGKSVTLRVTPTNTRGGVPATVPALVQNHIDLDSDTITTALPAGSTAKNYTLTVADFNRDGVSDAVVVRPPAVLVLLGRPDGTFVTGGEVNVGAECVELVARDVTGDGILDIVCGVGTRVKTLRGNGAGGFTFPTRRFGTFQSYVEVLRSTIPLLRETFDDAQAPDGFTSPRSATSGVPSSVKSTLSGFTSRWTIPRSCARPRARASWIPSARVSPSVIRPLRARRFPSEPPLRSGMTTNGTPSASPTSRSGTKPERSPSQSMSLASRANRTRSASSSARRRLIATSRPSVERARYTVPAPPRPIASRRS
jgi:hypothetical protein